jgi:hypothetical protein
VAYNAAKAGLNNMASSRRYGNGTLFERASLMSDTKISLGMPSSQGLSLRRVPERSDHPAASAIRPGKRVTSLNVGA